MSQVSRSYNSIRDAPVDITDWSRTDSYHNSFLIHPDANLEGARAHSAEQGLPDIAVSVAQGKFLKLIAQSIGAKRIIEVGVLGGYSTIWMGQAVGADGEVVGFELSEKHAQVARENFVNAGLDKIIKVVVGPAIDGLKALQADPPFDLVFIDADKQSSLDYFVEAKRLVRKGGIIIVDNVVFNGSISREDYSDPPTEGNRRLLRALKEDHEVDATTISTVGEKGYDGFIFVRKL
ncbi:O-methyltransferase family 3 protein [Athelia psychrophila]|uniref:O-methyltransferase family 3 protein n=1 Tax=Athelia psychrophila TaxID=1759441 RepID=A0A166JW57_9AGAM|nr:O-methyltransferase family 3 protein [Fibularhizoctonia sp. CBS 109695]